MKRNILQLEVSGMGQVAAHSNKRLLNLALMYLHLPYLLEGGTFVSARKKLYTCWELVQHAQDEFGLDMKEVVFLHGARILAQAPEHGIKFRNDAPNTAAPEPYSDARVEELDDESPSQSDASASHTTCAAAPQSFEEECAQLRAQVAKYKRRFREAWHMRDRQRKLETMMHQYDEAMSSAFTVPLCNSAWVKQKIEDLDRRSQLATEYCDELDRGIREEGKRREAQEKLVRSYHAARAKVQSELGALACKRQKLQAASELIDECRD